jgi:hypothetical protein
MPHIKLSPRNLKFKVKSVGKAYSNTGSNANCKNRFEQQSLHKVIRIEDRAPDGNALRCRQTYLPDLGQPEGGNGNVIFPHCQGGARRSLIAQAPSAPP